MRIWDISPEYLCRQHLLGEHRELHGLWNILQRGGGGYWNHPETQRWVGHEGALYLRHLDLVYEMSLRGYNHKSPLENPLIPYEPAIPPIYLQPIDEQIKILRAKPCGCFKE